ncbi:transporter substrate-binding domain-containing protein [Desulfovibrio mangrovi]|uniref:substrate-binding periplasmic protein n=1 Tax=Desulfovibrio mangrovi TaxID=2976983 RepID=UPI00224671F9|nr:transporter substrate-binding domain-containing protein [Desulfovibrio mangrovi]UZP66967.1 transporter substrate-binding domain-containing protein [Desulfovibrio mangrovi]
MKQLLAIFLIISAVLGSWALALADKEGIHHKVTLPVDDWPPYRTISSGSMSGLDFDLMKELAGRLGFRLNYQPMPWNRSLAQMKQGKADAMTGLARRPERELYIYYIEPPYSSCSTVFYTPKGQGDSIRTYEDLNGKRLGFVLGSAYFPRFDEDKSLNKMGVVAEEQLIRMGLAGRLDVFVGTDCQVDYEIMQQGLGDKLEKAVYRPENKVDLYLGVSRYSLFFEHVDELERVMRQMKRDGTLKRINDAYFAPKVGEKSGKQHK